MTTLDTRYQDALDYIYSYVDFSRTRQSDLTEENFDLTRMVRFMEELGNPERDYPSIHIAGSKGKGSVSAFCAFALREAGYRVGLYTSPHIKDFEERIQVNQQSITREELVDYVEEIKPAVDAVPGVTTFEIMTGLTLLYFARRGVDLAVIEVGLGGRLDATNIITPRVSVITSLYLDHISLLGDTLDKIAYEKGGIIKPGIPVVSSPQKPAAMEVLRDIAENQGADLIEAGISYPVDLLASTLDGQVFCFQDRPGEQYSIPLLGKYQVTNAVTAYAALDVLREQGFKIPEQDIKQGFSEVVWPARFEILRRRPPVVVDSAHNPASIRKLRETIDEFYQGYPLILVFGISEDKQLEEMYQAILPRTSHLICTSSEHPRALGTEDLVKKASIYDCSVESIPEVGDALVRALELAGDQQLVLVTGSIFVAASGRIAWFERSLGSDPV